MRRFVDAGLCDADQNFAIASDHHLAQLAALKAGLGFGLCQTQIAKSHDLIHELPHDFGFEVKVQLLIYLRSSLLATAPYKPDFKGYESHGGIPLWEFVSFPLARSRAVIFIKEK